MRGFFLAVWAAMRAADDVAVYGVKRWRVVAWKRWPCGSWNVLPFHRAATVAGRAQRGGVSSGGGCVRKLCRARSGGGDVRCCRWLYVNVAEEMPRRGRTCGRGSLNAYGMPCMMSVRAERGGLMCLRCGSHAVAVFWWLCAAVRVAAVERMPFAVVIV